ncbi:MAG: ferredoxin [Halioglobus sp.]|jgi:ferredoxin
MKIKIDLDLCQGHSVCITEAPEIFDVVDAGDGYPLVKVLLEDPPEDLREKLERAVKFCPNRVISIIED